MFFPAVEEIKLVMLQLSASQYCCVGKSVEQSNVHRALIVVALLGNLLPEIEKLLTDIHHFGLERQITPPLINTISASAILWNRLLLLVFLLIWSTVC